MEVQRKRIDSLDTKLIEILGARQRAVKKIGIYKAKNNIPTLQVARFQEVMSRTIEAGQKQGLAPEFVARLMTAIHVESLRIEDSLRSGTGQ